MTIIGEIREAWDKFWDRLLENNGALLHVVGDLVIRTAAIYFGKVDSGTCVFRNHV